MTHRRVRRLPGATDPLIPWARQRLELLPGPPHEQQVHQVELVDALLGDGEVPVRDDSMELRIRTAEQVADEYQQLRAAHLENGNREEAPEVCG